MATWIDALKAGDHHNWIAGEWRPADRQSRLVNPGRQSQVIGAFAESSVADAEAAVEAAAAAFPAWRDVAAGQRAAALFRLADLIERNAVELAFIVSAEQGKVLAEGVGEVARSVAELRFTAGEALRADGASLPTDKSSGLAWSVREPIGVVAAIAPWNFPLLTPVRKLGPALAYGCTLVMKPSQLTPWSVVRLMQLTAEAGIPAGVVNMVTGSGRVTGEAIIGHHKVRGVTFTGSTAVGKSINARIAPRLARQQLELGGKNPAVVLSYKDAAVTARQIVAAAFACSGQRCTSISRVIVGEALAGELTDAIVAEVGRIRLGPAWEAGATMGPLIDRNQFNSVQDYIGIGKAEGARLATGGNAVSGGVHAEGNYIEPTVFDRVIPAMRVAREEIFGPVISIVPVADFEAGVVAANAVDYGLAAAVFSNDVDEALHFARLSESGMVHINHGTASEPHIPFGGVKDSGAGAYSIGHANQDFFTNLKVIYAQAR